MCPEFSVGNETEPCTCIAGYDGTVEWDESAGNYVSNCAVTCPAHSVHTGSGLICSCKACYEGSIVWNRAMGKQDGECVAVEVGSKCASADGGQSTCELGAPLQDDLLAAHTGYGSDVGADRGTCSWAQMLQLEVFGVPVAEYCEKTLDLNFGWNKQRWQACTEAYLANGCQFSMVCIDIATHNSHLEYNISNWVPDLQKQPILLKADMMYNASHGTFLIDGDLSDWDCYTYHAQVPFANNGDKGGSALDPSEMMEFDAWNGGTWSDALDHSTAFAMSWDAANFYMGIKVYDDDHQLSGRNGWNGDSIELLFSDVHQQIIYKDSYADIDELGENMLFEMGGFQAVDFKITRDETTKTTTYEITTPNYGESVLLCLPSCS